MLNVSALRVALISTSFRSGLWWGKLSIINQAIVKTVIKAIILIIIKTSGLWWGKDKKEQIRN